MARAPFDRRGVYFIESKTAWRRARARAASSGTWSGSIGFSSSGSADMSKSLPALAVLLHVPEAVLVKTCFIRGVCAGADQLLLPCDTGCITGIFENVGKSPFFVVEISEPDIVAEIISARHETCSGGITHGRRTVGVCKQQTLLRQPAEVRRLRVGMAAQAADTTIISRPKGKRAYTPLVFIVQYPALFGKDSVGWASVPEGSAAKGTRCFGTIP